MDRNGAVLADNHPAFQIELVREQVGDTKSLDATLSSLVNIGLLRPEEVGNIRRTVLLHKVYESVPIKLQLTEEEMALFAVHRHQFSGVDIRTRLARHYPLGETAVHAIGYVSAINEQDLKQIDSDEYAGTSLIGKLGVEARLRATTARQTRFPRNSGQRRRPTGREAGRIHAASCRPAAGRRRRPDSRTGYSRAESCRGGAGRQARIRRSRSTRRRAT